MDPSYEVNEVIFVLFRRANFFLYFEKCEILNYEYAPIDPTEHRVINFFWWNFFYFRKNRWMNSVQYIIANNTWPVLVGRQSYSLFNRLYIFYFVTKWQKFSSIFSLKTRLFFISLLFIKKIMLYFVSIFIALRKIPFFHFSGFTGTYNVYGKLPKTCRQTWQMFSKKLLISIS